LELPDCHACRLGQLTVSCRKQDDEGNPCAQCNGEGLRLHRHTVVDFEGTVPNDILFLGEAPGYHEDLDGLPFRPHAPAGGVLRRALLQLDMTPVLDNIVHCRPPDNKLRDYPDAIKTCSELWLDRALAIVQPKVIVAMGALAGQLWFPGLRATEMSKLARVVVRNGIKYVVVGSFHPSYVARGSDPAAGPSMIESLRRAMMLAREGI